MPRMGKLLTARQVDSAPAGATRREIPDGGNGLFLVVQPSRAKSWCVRYRHKGRPKKLTIGPYPAFGLADARERADAVMRAVHDGSDPAAMRREEKRRPPDLVRNVCASFIELYCQPRNKTWREVERTLALHVYPAIGDREIRDVTRRDIIDILDRVGGARANKVLAMVRKLCNWAVGRDIIEVSPVVGIKAPAPIQFRDRVLTDDELVAFLHGCQLLDAEPLAPRTTKDDRKANADWRPPSRFGSLFKLLLLTGQRRDEVASAPWSEFDLERDKLWRLPGSRTKNSHPNDVPLSPQAVALIGALPSLGKNDLLFPSYRVNGNASSGFSRAKRRLDEIMLWELRNMAKANGDDPNKVTLPEWRLHDLRRTSASSWARLGVGVHVVERLLNHISGASGGIVGIYQRHDYRSEKRKAVELWADFLDALCLPTPQAKKVVRLKPRQ